MSRPSFNIDIEEVDQSEYIYYKIIVMLYNFQVKSKVGSNIPDELSIFKSEPSSVADI